MFAEDGVVACTLDDGRAWTHGGCKIQPTSWIFEDTQIANVRPVKCFDPRNNSSKKEPLTPSRMLHALLAWRRNVSIHA